MALQPRAGMPTDLASEYQFIGDPNRLMTGLSLREQVDKKKGRIIFSLEELPLKVKYITDLGNLLERVSSNEVRYAGSKKLYVNNLEALLGPKPSSKPATSVSKVNIEYEDSVETKQMINEAESTAKESKVAVKRMLGVAEQTQQLGTEINSRLDDQTEQIKRVQQDIDRVHYNLDRADKELKTIGSVFGQLANAVHAKKPKDPKTNDKIDKELQKDNLKKEKEAKKNKKKDDKEQKRKDKLLGVNQVNKKRRDTARKN